MSPGEHIVTPSQASITVPAGGTGRCQVHSPEEIRVHPGVVRKAVEAELSVPGTQLPGNSGDTILLSRALNPPLRRKPVCRAPPTGSLERADGHAKNGFNGPTFETRYLFRPGIEYPSPDSRDMRRGPPRLRGMTARRWALGG
jgi:hypothetical protein